MFDLQHYLKNNSCARQRKFKLCIMYVYLMNLNRDDHDVKKTVVSCTGMPGIYGLVVSKKVLFMAIMPLPVSIMMLGG